MVDRKRAILTVEEYLAEVLALVTPVAESERVPLREASGRTLAEPVLEHRMALTFAARAEGMSVRDVIAALVEQAKN